MPRHHSDDTRSVADSSDDRSRFRLVQRPAKRMLGDKLQELAARAPEYLIALDTLVDLALRTLTEK